MSPRGPKLRVDVLSGSLQGGHLTFDEGRVIVGRGAEAGLRFNPDLDLDVSGRHAELLTVPGGWAVRDLGSTNGTWVNGVEVTSPRALQDGDEIRFGREGPRARVRLIGADARIAPGRGSGAEDTSGVRGASGPGPAPGPQPPLAGSSGGSSGGPMGARGRLAIVSAVAVAAVSVVLLLQWSGRSAWRAEREALTNRIDSLLERETSRGAEVEATLAAAADSVALARAEVERLRTQLQSSETRPGEAEVEDLRRRLQEATVLLERQQIAASLDFDRIRRMVEPAVAMIWSERADGSVTTGTAVAIDAGGTLLTSRHVVAPAEGGPGQRFAVQFAGSAQVWRADVLGTHPDVDLAWARPEGIVGTVPHLTAFNTRADTFAVGSPVAIVGFPLGGRPGPAGEGTRRRAIVSGGVLLAPGADGLRIQGYGAQGASGSPVVDQDGRLIGVVYGAVEESGVRILLAVPIRYAEDGRPGF